MIKSTIRLIGLLSRKFRDDHIGAFSAQAAFFIIIAFFPFIMLLLSIVQYFPIRESTILTFITQAFPIAVRSMLVTVIIQIYDNSISTTLISVTAISALWSAGKGFLITSAFYTLVFAFMLIATMILFVFGNRLFYWIEHKIPILMDTALVIISLRTILGLIVLILFFLVIYVFIFLLH
ncbi:MAG: putative rane protein [Herbinix sp.]|nr:putative rane protein [Herbinix sp.]